MNQPNRQDLFQNLKLMAYYVILSKNKKDFSYSIQLYIY